MGTVQGKVTNSTIRRMVMLVTGMETIAMMVTACMMAMVMDRQLLLVMDLDRKEKEESKKKGDTFFPAPPTSPGTRTGINNTNATTPRYLSPCLHGHHCPRFPHCHHCPRFPHCPHWLGQVTPAWRRKNGFFFFTEPIRNRHSHRRRTRVTILPATIKQRLTATTN